MLCAGRPCDGAVVSDCADRNINTFAARAEKLSFIKSNCNAISIAIDDLMIYQDYFESPLFFLHYLKNR